MSICQHTHPWLRTWNAPRCCRLPEGHEGDHDSGTSFRPEPWPNEKKPEEPFDFRTVEVIQYDTENGEMQTFVNDTVTELVKVRARLQEAVLRQAVILELEKLGYTVISPEEEIP